MRAIDHIVAGCVSLAILLSFIVFRLRIDYGITGSVDIRRSDVYLLLFCMGAVMPSVYFVVGRASKRLHIGSQFSLVQLLSLVGVTALFFSYTNDSRLASFPPWSIDRSLELTVILGLLSIPLAVFLLVYSAVHWHFWGAQRSAKNSIRFENEATFGRKDE